MGLLIDYDKFLGTKIDLADTVGIDVPSESLNPKLFPFQREIVRWALSRGRAAIFADCGLGKSPIQLSWAHEIHKATGGNVLILAPLAVAQQTGREAEKFGYSATVCRSQMDTRPGINVTNYEMLNHFDSEQFTAIVCDESSILKSYDGATRTLLTEFARTIPYRLCCTASPAPNDISEIINHAEFLDIMRGKEIIALYFTQDGNTSHRFRLKGHAKAAFWQWLASWSVALRKPSDMGFADDGYDLPPLSMHQITVESNAPTNALFETEAQTLQERRQARTSTLTDRVAMCAGLVNASAEPWIVWCNLNVESEALAKAIPDAVEVRGSDSNEHKERAVLDFTSGKVRVLVTKPTIFGFGLNLQHCRNVAFVGLSDSYEQYYQAIRRCWRFGQAQQVNCYVITSEAEGAVVRNIERKEKQSSAMFDNLISHMKGLTFGQSRRNEMDYQEDTRRGQLWTMHKGDCVAVIDRIPADSVGFSIFSPPFPGMYAYSNSTHDMGNTRSIEEMMAHFDFLIAPEKLLRVMMPGRSCCIHLTQYAAFKHADGYTGLKDFRGRVIAAMEKAGWIYYGEVTIDKNPQVKAVRTKDAGLMFKSLANDSAKMHVAMADYLLQFKKPGDNTVPIRAGISAKYENPEGWITSEEWIRWARPVWYAADWNPTGDPNEGIRETDVLNVAQARDTDDERHLCPLQIPVIERAVKLWSAPGETVLSPFAGIGSEGVVSVRLNRRFVGIELKDSYWQSAVRNLEQTEIECTQADLFAGEPAA